MGGIQMNISDKPAGKRTAVTEYQARMLASLIQDLERTVGRSTVIELQEFRALPEYSRLELGGYACGFVCRDMKLDPQYEQIMGAPRHYLEAMPFAGLRQFVHTLWRAERWADGYGSPIKDALENGALNIIGRRLMTDDSLRNPQVIDEIFNEG